MIVNVLLILTVLIYAGGISVGILGVGSFLWQRLRREEPTGGGRALAFPFEEHPFLSLGIAWSLGYFVYEGVFSLLSVTHLFQPGTVLVFGGALTLWGCYCLFPRKKEKTSTSTAQIAPWSDMIILAGLSGFVFFWNLYPSFDVDSLAFYFRAVQRFLTSGVRSFTPFADVRLNVPLGENLLYALGFAVWPRSTLFAQIIHGLGKVIFLLCAYGAARSLGCRRLSLLAAALIVADEHWLVSGANAAVRINMPLTLALFLLCLALSLFYGTRQRRYLLLAWLTICGAVACKFLGIVYLSFVLPIVVVTAVYEPGVRQALTRSWRRERFTAWAALGGLFFAALPYIHNWLMTGTPIFPASLGPWQASCYDQAVQEIAGRWHYHLSLAESIKNVSAFLVWPGILASKILLPLVFLSAFITLISSKETRPHFYSGLIFFTLSLAVTVLHEQYMVFEMRYYRYGIGLYALTACCLMTFLFQVFLERHQFLRQWEHQLALALSVAVCLFCLRSSFAGMGPARPSARDITTFLSGQKSEPQIMSERLRDEQGLYATLNAINPDPSSWAYFLSFQWPHAIYPLEGRNFGFLHSAAFSSETYFNEGLLAEALLKEKVTLLFNQIVTDRDYPLPGGAVYSVLEDCGKPIMEGKREFLALSEVCLQDLARKKDPHDARQRLGEAMTAVRSEPSYTPFLPPPYGGPFKVIR